MKNKLNEILSLMERIDNIGAGQEYFDDSNTDDLENNGNLHSRLTKEKPKSMYNQTNARLEDYIGDDSTYILFVDMINRIGLYKKKKAAITQDDIENAFVNSIKNRKIFCPQLTIDELRNEIIERNDEKSGEQEFEFNKGAVDSNIKNAQTPLKLLGRYYSTYERIRKNITGRLGQFFELLFGKSPDNSPNSDFGEGENSIEIKTKNLLSQNGIIALTKFGLETPSELFSNDSEIIFSGPLKEQLTIALNERLISLAKERNIGFDDMVIDVRNCDISKKNAKRKSFPVSSRIEDGEEIIHNEDIASITIYENSVSKFRDAAASYNLSLTCVLRKSGSSMWFVYVLMQLIDSKNPSFTRNIEAKVPINYLLKKVARKCPTLFIASGGVEESEVPGWRCKSDIYAYTKADIFKWSGIDEDDMAMYLIKSGQLKVDFGISSGTFMDVSKIVIDSSLSFDYYKLMNRLATFGKELFPEQQLFLYEKSI